MPRSSSTSGEQPTDLFKEVEITKSMDSVDEKCRKRKLANKESAERSREKEHAEFDKLLHQYAERIFFVGKELDEIDELNQKIKDLDEHERDFIAPVGTGKAKENLAKGALYNMINDQNASLLGMQGIDTSTMPSSNYLTRASNYWGGAEHWLSNDSHYSVKDITDTTIQRKEMSRSESMEPGQSGAPQYTCNAAKLEGV